MTQQPDLTEWDEDVTASTEDEYAALLRAIRWAQGFSLLFVQCSPAEGERLVQRVRQDVAEKVIKVLPLESEIEDLYEVVATHPDIDKTNVLFITGLEKSLVSYIQPGFGSEGAYYAKDIVPKLLGKLNLQRERFKEDFAVCFVFLVPRYAMKYLIRRAADFFDWRSGVWEFVPPREEQQQVAQQILQEGGYKQYLSWTPQQRRQRVQEINDLLANAETLEVESSALHFEKGNILAADKQFEAALAAFDAVLALNPSSHEVFHNRGSVLSNLGRTEEALAAFNAALAIKPDKREALNNKGIALYRLGRYEEALAAFDATLAIKPDDDAALNNKGCVLADLGRYEETIALCDAALAINPDDHTALYNKGNALYRLSRYKEAMATFDVVLAITPDKQTALNNKGNALSDLGHYEKALTAFDAALALEPDKYAALNNKGNALSDLGRYEEAIVVYDAALATTPDKHEVLKNKGNALAHLGRHEEAIALCDAALAIKPNDHQALYNKACCYSLQGKVELALENLSQAIQLNPSECCKRAQTDTDFDAIRDHPDFKALLAET